MLKELLKRMGKKAFVQSIRPYKGQIFDGVEIFGLDTEYVPRLDKASELICWQLASSREVRILTKPLSIENLYKEAKRQIKEPRKHYVFVSFFSMSELQFFNLDEWQLSEFKGRYRVKQTYGDGQLMVVDLADWFPSTSLSAVGELWKCRKLEYPIGKKVEAIARGELTKRELLVDPAFREYASNDAVIQRAIYEKMRNYFLGLGVDIVSTMTPANTSASMFRQGLSEAIGQKNTDLRELSLQACWGGRMECVFRGERPEVFEYDAVAHHPSSTIALGKLPLEKDWVKASSLKELVSGIGGVAHVYFRFPATEVYPCLPVYHDGCLMFPLEGTSYCAVSEIRLALSKKAKVMLLQGYYYKNGITALADYLRSIQALRNSAKDGAERQMLKLISNSVIGKLFQKKMGTDLALVQAYALEHQLPYEEALKLEGVEFGDKTRITLGSCFYPEWYSLILGYARANIGEAASRHHALMISSDSLVVTENLGESFELGGITYTLKVKGSYVGYRTRFYRVGDKLAHHAVHNKEAAKEVLCSFLTTDEFAYKAKRYRHLKESWRDGTPFGSSLIRNMIVKLCFDNKRSLLPTGWSVPHRFVEEKIGGETDVGNNDGSGEEAGGIPSGNKEKVGKRGAEGEEENGLKV